jgi:hypothetical protein
MMNLDADAFARVAKTATERAGRSRRWRNAIERAADLLFSNPFWHVTDEGTLLVLSPDSLAIYETDGVVCERVDDLDRRVACRAYAEGQPCKHRAAHRLLLRYQQSH